jgi:hypothetical protein
MQYVQHKLYLPNGHLITMITLSLMKHAPSTQPVQLPHPQHTVQSGRLTQ